MKQLNLIREEKQQASCAGSLSAKMPLLKPRWWQLWK
jgi:hypothetical protein